MEKWGLSSMIILPRKFFDHCPILLLSQCFDFGLMLFRFFNSWLSLEGFDGIVKKAWENSFPSGTSDRRFAHKLKAVKNDIKKWRVDSKRSEMEEQNLLLLKIDQIELIVEERPLTTPERDCRKKMEEHSHGFRCDLQI